MRGAGPKVGAITIIITLIIKIMIIIIRAILTTITINMITLRIRTRTIRTIKYTTLIAFILYIVTIGNKEGIKVFFSKSNTHVCKMVLR